MSGATAGCAVFDLDGTLVDSVPLFAAIGAAMLRDRGADRQISAAQVRPYASAGGLAMIAVLLGDVCGDPHEALADFRARYAALPTPADSLYPGARRALESLAGQGVVLSLWSNKTQILCDKIVDELALAPLFASVVGTGPGVPLKPDLTGLDLALAGAGATRRSCCFIGDSDLDHESARRAGVPFVMMTHGYGDYARDWPGAVMVAGFDAVPAAVMAALPTQPQRGAT